MAQGRMLNAKIAHNEALAGVSLEAALLFTWCVPHLDRDGRMAGHPSLVKAEACPLIAAIPEGLVPSLLVELAHAGLVEWYREAGKSVLHFPGFLDSQQGTAWRSKEAPSRWPARTPESVDLAAAYRGTPAAPPAPPSSSPPREELEVERTQAYTLGEIREAADTTLGMGRLSRSERNRNHRIITMWEGRGMRRETMWATIHGAAMLRDEGATWLEKGQPYALNVLVNTEATQEIHGDKVRRSLAHAAVERYEAAQRKAAEAADRRRPGPDMGLQRIDLTTLVPEVRA